MSPLGVSSLSSEVLARLLRLREEDVSFELSVFVVLVRVLVTSMGEDVDVDVDGWAVFSWDLSAICTR